MGNVDNKTLSRETRLPASAPRGAAQLRAVYPPSVRWRIPLGTAPCTVGRVPHGDVPAIDHRAVSRTHMVVAWDRRAKRHTAADCDSHNGTRVNGVGVVATPQPLNAEAVIQLGDVLLVYEQQHTGDTDDSADVSRDSIPGDSPSVRAVRAAVAVGARDVSPMLIIGETGTGKERIAAEIHRLSGRSGPLIAVNCAALSAQLIDSQLFGHVRGAFTGAVDHQPGMFRAADGGTLFLDEVGELPVDLQPKLLRALQEKQVQPVGAATSIGVDVRVVAATNVDLASAVAEERFRRDLYARLALWEVRIPPLRQRRGDILFWVDRLRRAWTQERQLADSPLCLRADAAEAVVLAQWPDNLRGVDRLVHELSARDRPDGHAAAELPAWIGGRDEVVPETPAKAVAAAAAAAKPPVPSQAEFEAAFRELDGNVRGLSRRFGRDRRQIYRWIDAYGLRAVE